MRHWMHVLVGFGMLTLGPLRADEMRFQVEGGAQLSIRAVAEQQQWITHGEKIWVAAVANGQLVVKDISLSVSPQPDPGPQPQPEPGPEPQPAPVPKTVIWIEETGQRTPQQAAAITDAKLRAALTAARWTLRIADVDVVDETGRPPSDLASYLERAKQAGLPWLVILENGRELYTGKAPPDVSSFANLLRRYGLPVGTSGEDAGVPIGTSVADKHKETSKGTASCPTGTCPAQTPSTRRWRLFR